MREMHRFPTYQVPYMVCTSQAVFLYYMHELYNSDFLNKKKVTGNAKGQERKRVTEDLLCRLLAGKDTPHWQNIISCLPGISHHSGHPV